MDQISTVGIAVDAAGRVVLQKAFGWAQLVSFFQKLPACLIRLEACSSAHHWGRELTQFGHHVRLIPPAYVKPYVRRQKNDVADAAAICEAVTRPSMRFVAIKTEERQSALMIHRVRSLLMSQRTALICALRGHMAELSLTAPWEVRNLGPLLEVLADEADDSLPALARAALRPLVDHLASIGHRLAELDRQLIAWHRASGVSQRLATIPGSVPSQLRPWPPPWRIRRCSPQGGISPPSWDWSPDSTPRAARSGSAGYPRWGIATCVISWSAAPQPCSVIPRSRGPLDVWAKDRLEKNKPIKLDAVALANKMARIAWALMIRGESFRQTETAAA